MTVRESKVCLFKDLKWEQAYLHPIVCRSEEDRKKKRSLTADKDKSGVELDGSILYIGPESGRGKVSDAGYDLFSCCYTKFPVSTDICITALVRVYSFPRPEGMTGQEGFGLFFRDTMEADSETGYPYSNMAAIGGWLGSWNVFGRTGISSVDIEQASSFALFGRGTNPESCDIPAGSYRTLTLTLERRGFGLRAAMRDEDGRNLLTYSADDSGMVMAPGFEFLSPDSNGDCLMVLPPDLFSQRDSISIYAGFFAAGCRIAVDTESVRVTVIKRPGRTAKKGTIYASAEGSCLGYGTENSPCDLQTALLHCPEGGEVVVLSGIYRPRRDVVIPQWASGHRNNPKRLICPSTRTAVLDFGGTDHAFKLHGNHWVIENLKVTGGYGFQVQGSHNRIMGCEAVGNLETGFLVRHENILSSRKYWPSYNVIEDCTSHENRDPADFNADGFACKIASGEGNRFIRCTAYLNTDDGFDLFAKNRRIGAVELIDCRSFQNGYYKDEEGGLHETAGNGTGFKLGGSGLAILHSAMRCEAFDNKGKGFTSNSNPWWKLTGCSSWNNGKVDYDFYYTGSGTEVRDLREDCNEEEKKG